MDNLPKVDVVLLSWNRSKLTIETIKSILTQKGVAPKIWIVDQGSHKEELQTLKEFTSLYSDIFLTELEHNIGVPGGRNVGTRQGSARYTVSIDNDAVFESDDSLKKVVDFFESDPQVGAVSFRIKNFYSRDDDELSWVFPKRLKENRDSSFITTRFSGCGHAIRRDVFEDSGGYDDQLFFYWEEVDISYRIINAGLKIVYNPDISVLHKVSPEARVKWGEKRFYFLVRNAIYMSNKYYQNNFRTTLLILGYSVKGCLNILFRQTFLGVLDGIKMCIQFNQEQALTVLPLSKQAEDYIWQYELCYRGNLLTRIKNEVLVGLPGRK